MINLIWLMFPLASINRECCLKLSKMLELTADNAEGAHRGAVRAGGGGQTYKCHTFAQQSSGPIPRLWILLEVVCLAN